MKLVRVGSKQMHRKKSHSDLHPHRLSPQIIMIRTSTNKEAMISRHKKFSTGLFFENALSLSTVRRFWLNRYQPWESAVCFPMSCSAVCSHLYSDWVWIMLSVLYNLEYCMQNGPYWLCRSAEYKKGSAPAYTDNPLRKQRPARSSNEYKTPNKSQALAWHPASVLSSLR